MTDQPFTTWPFPAATGTAPRTLPVRFDDVYNVKDFGASSSGDATPGIQAAVNAACATGGTVYFPPGNYNLGSRVVVPSNSNRAITLLGCGGQEGAGSKLNMSSRDYIIYCEHGPTGGGGAGTTVRLIQGLSFSNIYNGAAPTSTEPASTTDGTTGDGCGAIYMSGGTGNCIRDCNISIMTGVGIFSTGFQNKIENINIGGSYAATGNDVNKTIGIFTRSSTINTGKMTSLGTAIVMIMGPSQASFLDIEVGGLGITTGEPPIAYWESNENSMAAAGQNRPCVGGVVLDHITMESLGVTHIWFKRSTGGTARLITAKAFDQIGVMTRGFNLERADGMHFQQCSVTGNYSTAAIDTTGMNNCLFEFCGATNSSGTGGVPWLLPTFGTFSGSGCFWDRSSIDGALAFSFFPTAPVPGTMMWCSNCTSPTWTGTASNVGKPIVGGGSNKVLGRWNGTAWVIAG